MRRRLVIVAGAMAAFGAFAVAQGSDHCHGVLLGSARTARDLDLTAPQKAQLLAIMRDDPPGPERERAVQAILTPEQRQKYELLKRARC